MLLHGRGCDEEVGVFARVCFGVEGRVPEENRGDDAEGGAVPKLRGKLVERSRENTGGVDDAGENGMERADCHVEHPLGACRFVEDAVDGKRDESAGKNDRDEFCGAE